MEAFTEDIEAAVALSKVGSDLILEHEFARDSLEPKCTQLRIMCKTQEILFLERRQTLLKFVDLFEGLESLAAWCSTTTQHLNMDLDMDRDTDRAVGHMRTQRTVRDLAGYLVKCIG